MRPIACLSLSLAILSAAFAAAFVGMAQTPSHRETTAAVSSALARGGVISGRVLDERGEPVVNEPIRLMKTDERGRIVSHRSSLEHAQTTDDRGAYRFYGLPPGMYYVLSGFLDPGPGAESGVAQIINRPTYFPKASSVSDAVAIDVGPGSVVIGIDITLPPPIRLVPSSSPEKEVDPAEWARLKSFVGRAVTTEGKPVAATVILRSVDGRQIVRSVTSDTDGRFTLASLREGSYRIDLYARGYRLEGRELWESIEVRPGEERTFRFTRGGVISGRVINERGEPVAGMSVAAIRLKDQSDRRPEHFSSNYSPRRFTDDRGYYRLFNLVPGSYYVAANFANIQRTKDSIYQDASMIFHTAPGAESRTAVQVVDGGEMEGIELIYRGERGARVSGRLITGIVADEKPRGMRVVIADREAHAMIGIYDTSTSRPSYVLTGLAEGDYDLLAYGGADGPIPLMSQVHRLAIRRGETRSLDIRLEQPGTISGTVELSIPKDLAASCPAAGQMEVKRIKIRAQGDHRSNDYVLPLFAYRAGTPDESGRFLLEGLRAGKYLIEVELPNEGWTLGSIGLIDQISQQPRTLDAGEILVPVKSGQETRVKIVVTPLKSQPGERGCAK